MKLNSKIKFPSITKNTWTQDQFFKIFCGIMLGGICLFLLFFLFFGFARWRCLFFILTDPSDSFMDFFNPVYWVQFKDIYSIWSYSNYLAFPYIIFILFSYIIPSEILYTSPVIIRSNIYGIISLIAFLSASLIPLMVLIFKNKRGSIKKKIIFLGFIILSAPFINSVERGNIIFLALFFMTFFVFYYDSQKRYLRELSLLFLAFAVAIKIYPAAIGVLLLKDKRYKDILLLGIYVLCLTIFPFFIYNGLGDIKLFVNRVLKLSQHYETAGYGYSVNIYTTLKMITYELTRREFPSLNTIFHYIQYLVLFLGALLSCFIDKKWKTVAIVCLLMVLVPSISWTYTLLFMIPPLVFFLNDNDEKSFRDLIYLILFCLIFMLNIPAIAPIFQSIIGYPVLMDNFCARLACLVMFCMLCWDGVRNVLKNKIS